jgi:hypothetical protein
MGGLFALIRLGQYPLSFAEQGDLPGGELPVQGSEELKETRGKIALGAESSRRSI